MGAANIRQRSCHSFNDMKTPFLKGVSFGFMARNGYYRSVAAQQAVEAIYASGADAVALIVTIVQESYHSTRMVADFHHTPGDLELAGMVEAFHQRGIRVMLKPMIECLDSVWRGHIKFPPAQQMIEGVQTDNWSDWFGHYADCMGHYARLAQDTGVDLFCIGCELLGCEPQEAYWPDVIARVRAEYTGPVTYNADQFRPGRPFVRNWFRLLDLLGVSFYTGVPGAQPSADLIAEALRPSADALEAVSREIALPLFFAECGCRSVEDGTREPWRYDLVGAYDGAAQANYLQGVLQAFSDCPWWRGLMWWKWDEQQIRPQYNHPTGETGFTIAGKPAADVFRRWTPPSHP